MNRTQTFTRQLLAAIVLLSAAWRRRLSIIAARQRRAGTNRIDKNCSLRQPFRAIREQNMKIRLVEMSLVFALGLLAAPPHSFAQQSCLPFLTNNLGGGGSIQLVTLNKNGVASSSQLFVSYRNIRSPSRLSAQWFTVNGAGEPAFQQLFSDRTRVIGAGTTAKTQPFDIYQADLINVLITVEASPQVTVTLRSWHDAKATFRGTCSRGGVIHGSTPDVDYLLFLTQFYPIQ